MLAYVVYYRYQDFWACFLLLALKGIKMLITFSACNQRYTYRVLQTIQMKVILLWVWEELAILGSAKTALKFKHEI